MNNKCNGKEKIKKENVITQRKKRIRKRWRSCSQKNGWAVIRVNFKRYFFLSSSLKEVNPLTYLIRDLRMITVHLFSILFTIYLYLCLTVKQHIYPCSSHYSHFSYRHLPLFFLAVYLLSLSNLKNNSLLVNRFGRAHGYCSTSGSQLDGSEARFSTFLLCQKTVDTTRTRGLG